MATANPRRGYALGLTAYVIWGLFPIYFKLLERIPALEIITHRAIWSALFGRHTPPALPTKARSPSLPRPRRHPPPARAPPPPRPRPPQDRSPVHRHPRAFCFCIRAARAATVAPMIFGIGVDLVETTRIRESLEKFADRFARKVFTPVEQEYCNRMPDPAMHYAARFAAKEAFWKAVGCGPEPVSLRDVEVDRSASGAPRIVLHGGAEAAAARLGVISVYVSMTHTATLASASVVLEGEGAEEGRKDA